MTQALALLPHWPLLLAVAAVFAVAGVVKGVIGLGLPTISMALLGSAMSPADAAALLVLPSLLTNVWQLRPWGALPAMLRRLATMQAGVCAGTLAGAAAIGAPVGAWAVVCLGGSLIAYAGWGLSGARLRVAPRTQRWLGPLVGALTGLVTAATGVFVVPAVPYLQALALDRDELMQAMGLSFTVSTVALAIGLCFNGRYPVSAFDESALMLLPAFAGMSVGQALRQRLSPTLFKTCFLASLIVLGVYMIVHEAFAR
jgi:uncharacterized membrane protein YfcA